jgi:hypothetical protein
MSLFVSSPFAQHLTQCLYLHWVTQLCACAMGLDEGDLVRKRRNRRRRRNRWRRRKRKRRRKRFGEERCVPWSRQRRGVPAGPGRWGL